MRPHTTRRAGFEPDEVPEPTWRFRRSLQRLRHRRRSTEEQIRAVVETWGLEPPTPELQLELTRLRTRARLLERKIRGLWHRAVLEELGGEGD